MAAVRSIFEYVKAKCYNGLYAAAEEYLEENWPTMGLESGRVPTIQSVELIDATVERVYVTDRPGDRIAFDVGFELQIRTFAADHHGDREDFRYQWLRFSCEGDLSKGLDDWTFVGKPKLYVKNSKLPDNSMSDALVPEIRGNDEFERIATKILETYYPEALRMPKSGEAPVYVDPTVLAERLGLTIYTQRIREDGSVFGQLFFAESDTEMYDPKAMCMAPIHVPERSIVVDPQNFLLRNLGSANNTIVHECLHWILHRKVFLLEKLFNDKASGITCEVVGGATSEMNKYAVEKMESQANRLTPRLQMPAAPFKAKAQEYIARFMREVGALHESEVMEAVIIQLSTDYAVSKQAVKIRLVELGIESAVGTFTYVDGHYVRPHSYKKGAIARNQTFTISGQDAAIQRFTNPALRSLTVEGDYLFLENHFVYNTPLYVEKDGNGHLQLTRYALSHMDECCLVFDMTITGGIKEEYHTVCYLNREPSDFTFDITFHNGFENAPQDRQVAMRKAQQQEWMSIRSQMTDVQGQCLELLLDKAGLNYTELASIIDRDPKTISRIVKGETKPDLKTAVRICFALNLPPNVSEKFLEVTGCVLLPMDTSHQWIKEALHVKYPEPLEDVLTYLKMFDVKI